MIEARPNGWQVAGRMTLEAARALLEAGTRQLGSGAVVVDLSQVEAVDSSALAVLFGWMRAAQQKGGSLKIIHAPQQLMSLAALYGVAEMLPLDAQ